MANLHSSLQSTNSPAKITYTFPVSNLTFKALCLDLVRHKIISRQTAYTLHNLLLMDANLRASKSPSHDGRYFLCTTNHVIGVWKRCFPWERSAKQQRTYSAATIERHLKKLCELGLITIDRKKSKGGLRRVRIYFGRLNALVSDQTKQSVATKVQAKVKPRHKPSQKNEGTKPPKMREPINNKNIIAGGEAPTPGPDTSAHLSVVLKNISSDLKHNKPTTPNDNPAYTSQGFRPTNAQFAYMIYRKVYDEYRRGRFGEPYRFRGRGIRDWKIFFSRFCRKLQVPMDESDRKTVSALKKFFKFAYQNYGRFDLAFLAERIKGYYHTHLFDKRIKFLKLYDDKGRLRLIPLRYLHTHFPTVFDNTSWMIQCYYKYSKYWQKHTGKTLNSYSDKLIADYCLVCCERLASRAKDAKHLGQLFIQRLQMYRSMPHFAPRVMAFDFDCPNDEKF